LVSERKILGAGQSITQRGRPNTSVSEGEALTPETITAIPSAWAPFPEQHLARPERAGPAPVVLLFAEPLVLDGPNRASSAGAEGLAAGMPEIAVGRDRPTILAGQAIPVLVFDLCKDSGQTADA